MGPWLFVTVLLWLPGRASAFSGTYVGAPGAPPLNRESRAVMTRAGQATTLTLFNDVQAGQSVFGLVVPVPVEIDSGNVRVLDPAVMAGVEAYSAPRAASVSCQKLYFSQPKDEGTVLDFSCSFGSSDEDDDLWFDTASGGESWEDVVTGVVVEDRFSVGEYEAFVLQAEDGAGLEAWLTDEGLSLPPGADEVLDDYIADGHYFLALRVVLDEAPTSPHWLTPIQVGYLSEEWSLPLRLGTLSSGGVQDLILFLLTGQDMGEVEIQNYGAAVDIPDECLLSEPEQVLSLYDELLDHSLGIAGRPEELGGVEGLAWAVEHRRANGECEPCTEHGPLRPDEVEALGMPDGDDPYLLTRIRLRYTPKALTEDPVLVATGRSPTPVEKRYLVGSWEVAGEFPLCAGVDIPEIGTCYSASWMAYREGLDEASQPYVPIDDRDGCKHHRALLLLALPGALGLLRRRRKA